MDKEDFSKKLTEFIDKYFGGSQRDDIKREVIKSVEQEQRIALFVVLEPQEGETTTDLHGDTYSAEDISKACRNFNDHCNKANLFHKVETEHAQIIESYISPVEFQLDNQIIKKGTWLQKWYFPETEVGETLWQAVKSGDINGVSIQARADTLELGDNDE